MPRTSTQQLETIIEVVMTLAVFGFGLWVIGLDRLQQWGGGSSAKVCRDTPHD